MANYRDLNKMISAYSKKINKALPKVGKKGEQIMSESIDTYVYGSYSPVEYQRTYSLQKSIFSVVESKDSHYFTLKVDFDTAQMGYSYMSLPPYKTDTSGIEEWQSIYGVDHREDIAGFLNNNRGWWNSSGTHFIDKGYKVFKDEFRDNFKTEMAKQKLILE